MPLPVIAILAAMLAAAFWPAPKVNEPMRGIHRPQLQSEFQDMAKAPECEPDSCGKEAQ